MTSDTSNVNMLPPDDETVRRWLSRDITEPIPDDLLAKTLASEEKMLEVDVSNLTSVPGKQQGAPNEDFGLGESAQNITTQDLMIPTPIVKVSRKRCRCETKINQKEKRYV